VTKVTAKERKEFLQSIPWVTWIKQPMKCQGKRYSGMPLKKIYNPTGKYDCKNTAHWMFRHTKRGDSHNRGKTKVYCMSHLFSLGLYGNMAEESRYQNWKKNREKIEAN
jgi:hypothetical protein